MVVISQFAKTWQRVGFDSNIRHGHGTASSLPLTKIPRLLKQHYIFTVQAADPLSSGPKAPHPAQENTLSVLPFLLTLQGAITMAAKMLLSPHPQPLFSFPFSKKLSTRGFTHHQVHPWLGWEQNPSRPKKLPLHVSLHEPVLSSSAVMDYIAHQYQQNPYSLVLLAESVGYSVASYYTSLGLFVISVPGLWSLIKRSVKSKIVQKTYIEGEKKAPNQVAGEILSFFTRNNFAVTDRGETITFEGLMVPNRGQAALLSFCTCISLASVALVLTITFPDVGNNWFWITILSPLAGAYYWTRASRKEQIKVKMIVAEDGSLSEIVVQGDDQQVEQMRKELKLSEKGMVYVKGVFEI